MPDLPLLTNGGGFLLLVVGAGFIVVCMLAAAVNSAARFSCQLVDRHGFPCGSQFRLRSTYEEHLTLCHDLSEIEARRAPSA